MSKTLWCGSSKEDHKENKHIEQQVVDPQTRTVYAYEWCLLKKSFRKKPFIELAWQND